MAHEFAAYGATVIRREITAYLKYKRGHYWLTTWAGGTMLHCRSRSGRAVLERWLGPDVSIAEGPLHRRLCSRRRWDVVPGRTAGPLHRRRCSPSCFAVVRQLANWTPKTPPPSRPNSPKSDRAHHNPRAFGNRTKHPMVSMNREEIATKVAHWLSSRRRIRTAYPVIVQIGRRFSSSGPIFASPQTNMAGPTLCDRRNATAAKPIETSLLSDRLF